MCYRCSTCGTTVPHRQPQIRKMVPRRRQGTKHEETAYEVAVCKGCDDILMSMGEDIGKALELLLKCNGQYRKVPPGIAQEGHRKPIKQGVSVLSEPGKNGPVRRNVFKR